MKRKSEDSDLDHERRTRQSPESLPVDRGASPQARRWLELQRTVGNRATARAIGAAEPKGPVAVQRQRHVGRSHTAVPVGLLTVDGDAQGLSPGTRTLFAEEEIRSADGGGFANVDDARTAVSGSSVRTIVVIVRRGVRFHAYDTHVVCPRPREYPDVVRVRFSPLGRADFVPVGFVNVDVTPDHSSDDHPEQAGSTWSSGMDAARRFEDAVTGVGGLSLEQAARCRVGIETVTRGEVELRDGFVFPFYTEQKLRIAVGHDLVRLNRGDLDAEFREFGGRVVLHPRVLDYPPDRLGALLFHEALHGREHRPSAGFGIGTAIQATFEAESYALQHVLLARGEPSTATRDLRSVFASGGGEIEPVFLRRFQDEWRQWYSVLMVLYGVIDGRVPPDSAPVVAGRRLAPRTARELVVAFARDFSHAASFESIINWPGRQAPEYRCPW